MIKNKQFTLLAIRFLGLFYALKSIGSIVLSILSFIALVMFIRDRYIPFCVELQSCFAILKNLLIIIPAIYLLKYGKFAFRLCKPTGIINLEQEIDIQSASEIILKVFGLWFFIQSFLKIIYFFLYLIEIYVSNRIDLIKMYRPEGLGFIKLFFSFLTSTFSLSQAVEILIYISIGYYLLKKGKRLANLIARTIHPEKQ